MSTTRNELQPDDLSLVYGGPTYRLALRLGLAHPDKPRRMRRGLLLVLITWIPLVLLSLTAGILHAPLLVFLGRLSRCRFAGLLELGSLALRHDRAFDEKWIKAEGALRESILGNPDVSTLADMAMSYEHVERMRLLPRDEKAMIVSVVAALLPLVPLIATQIPLMEIFAKLGEFIL